MGEKRASDSLGETYPWRASLCYYRWVVTNFIAGGNVTVNMETNERSSHLTCNCRGVKHAKGVPFQIKAIVVLAMPTPALAGSEAP